MENFSLLMEGFAHILSFNHVLLMMLGLRLEFWLASCRDWAPPTAFPCSCR